MFASRQILPPLFKAQISMLKIYPNKGMYIFSKKKGGSGNLETILGRLSFFQPGRFLMD
jgi:hypothetical protein